MFCGNNPVNFIDPDGRDVFDKFVGYSLGLLTNVVPGTGMTKVGGAGMIAGAKTTAAGMILMANSAQNKSGGYERGNTSSGNKNSKHANQKAKESAKDKYESAKANYEKYEHKANRTPEDKKMRDNYKKQMDHWKRKMEYTGENHSRNAKGNR